MTDALQKTGRLVASRALTSLPCTSGISTYSALDLPTPFAMQSLPTHATTKGYLYNKPCPAIHSFLNRLDLSTRSSLSTNPVLSGGERESWAWMTICPHFSTALLDASSVYFAPCLIWGRSWFSRTHGF